MIKRTYKCSGVAQLVNSLRAPGRPVYTQRFVVFISRLRVNSATEHQLERASPLLNTQHAICPITRLFVVMSEPRKEAL